MPATQNYRLPDWREPASLTGTHELHVPDTEIYLRSNKECAQFILLQGLPEITGYEGYPDLQQEMAMELADQIFDPEKDVLGALDTYLSSVREVGSGSPRSEAIMETSETTEPLAEVVELRTEFVVTRYDVETGEMLSATSRARSFG